MSLQLYVMPYFKMFDWSEKTSIENSFIYSKPPTDNRQGMKDREIKREKESVMARRPASRQ